MNASFKHPFRYPFIRPFAEAFATSGAKDFLAAWYKDSDYLMALQVFGVGDATSEHTADIYALNSDGVYVPFSDGKPVFEGGRYVSEDDVYATDASGALLDPAPSLKYSPLMTNLITTTYTVPNINVIKDKVGVDGAISAFTVTDSVTTGISRMIYAPIYVPASADVFCGVFYIKKELSTPNGNARIACSKIGSTAQYQGITFNPQSGAYLIKADPTGKMRVEVIDLANGWWKVIIEGTPSDAANDEFEVWYSPLFSDLDTTTQNDALTGSAVIHLAELYDNTTLEQIKYAGWLQTEGTALSTDRTVYQFDPANFSNSSMALYAEINMLGGSGLCFGSFLEMDSSGNFVCTDVGGNSASIPGTADGWNKVGVRVHADDSKMSIFCNGTWSADQTYSGTLEDLRSAVELFIANQYPGKIRNVRRKLGKSYDYQKTWIEDKAA